MKYILLISIIALLSASCVYSCHNFTGSCLHNGFFMCANEEMIPHSKRCDNIEDCADGTDEYMCDFKPKPISEMTTAERVATTEVACIKCTCQKGTITIDSTNTVWFSIAMKAPRSFTMMTDAPTYQNKPCNPATTTSIKLNVYKKQNKGCRGWVCCFRQEQCVSCSSGTTATHCY